MFVPGQRAEGPAGRLDILDHDIQGGGGGKNWDNDRIEAVVHIGGPFLGAPNLLAPSFQENPEQQQFWAK